MMKEEKKQGLGGEINQPAFNSTQNSGAWQAIVNSVVESDMIEVTQHAHNSSQAFF